MQYRYIGCRTCDHKSSIPNDWAWVTDWRVYKLDGDVVFPMSVSTMWCDDCEALTISEKWPDEVQINMELRKYAKSIDRFRRGETAIFMNANLVTVYERFISNARYWREFASTPRRTRCLKCGSNQTHETISDGPLQFQHGTCAGPMFWEITPEDGVCLSLPRRSLDADQKINLFYFDSMGFFSGNVLNALKDFDSYAADIQEIVKDEIKKRTTGSPVHTRAVEKDDFPELFRSLRRFVALEFAGVWNSDERRRIMGEWPLFYEGLSLFVRREVAKTRKTSSVSVVSSKTTVDFSGSRRPRAATKDTSLHKTAFAVLGATLRDDRKRIVELAEEKSLLVDHDACQKARADLTNPRNRLSAEMAWMPGVAPRLAEKLLATLREDPLSARSSSGVLPNLARANYMCAALEVVPEDEPAILLAAFIHDFALVVETLKSEDVLRDINEDRVVSGFPEVPGIEAIEEELKERRKAYRDQLKELLNSMDPEKLVETMTEAVEDATYNGEMQGPCLIDELVDSYEVETQGFLVKECENITTLIAGAREAAPKGERGVASIIDRLAAVAGNWDRVAQPIQLSMKSRGIVHRPSRDLAYELRSLGIDLCNEHEMLEQSERITALLRDLFAELPEVAEKLNEDSNAIAGLRTKAKESEKQNAQWERDITFHAEVGVVFKDELSISPRGVSWKGERYPLDAITRVRWGGVRNSVNGIPTGTDYTIGFGDNSSDVTVSLRKEATYSGFTNAMWRAVCVRLLFEMIGALKDGRSFSFGDIKVADDTVTLVKHKLLGSNERVTLGWRKVHIWSADGNFVIGSQEDKKIYGTASYIHAWNTHLLEHIVRGGFKKGIDKLSDYVKE